jgi:hypothetical protein
MPCGSDVNYCCTYEHLLVGFLHNLFLYVAYRHSQVAGYFPTALGVDDFITRVEVVLSGFGFTGDNSIGGELIRSMSAAPAHSTCQRHMFLLYLLFVVRDKMHRNGEDRLF